MDVRSKLMSAYRNGTLTNQQQKSLEQLIASGEISLEELDHFHLVLDEMIDPAQLKDTSSLDERFYEYLNRQSSATRRSWNWAGLFSPVWRLALAGAAILLAFWWGSQRSITSTPDEPTAAADQMWNELMTNDDISEKIHLVSSVKNEVEASNQKVIDALLFALISDESANVRLACIETLLDYADQPSVRAGLIRAIPHQNSPTVLAQLADAIRLSGEPMGTDKLRSLINKDLPPPLLKSMEDVLPTL